MASDNNIHKLFADKGDEGLGSIDTAAVIRRSKRRRLPAQLATGAAAVLVIGGLGFAGFQGLGQNAPEAETAAISAEESARDLSGGGQETYSLADRGPAAQVNLCASPLAEVVPAPSGLELTVDFPNAKAGDEFVEGSVVLTNTGTDPVKGYSAASPTITLSQDGIVKWHSNGAMIAIAIEVDLEPGESMEYAASFTPVECGVDDEGDAGFRERLPALPAGDYQVSALLDVSGADDTELVAGPPATVTLR